MPTPRVAMLKQWKTEPSSWNTSLSQVPEAVVGQIFGDPLGMHNDLTFVRIANIGYVIPYKDKLVVGTASCMYHLHYKDEDK